MSGEENKHVWKFYRYGGIDQVELESSDDLTHLDELDPKLWAAMTCPVSNVYFDAQTLVYIDTDGDKRVKIPEVLSALKWTTSMLKDPASIINPEDSLPLNAINENNEEAKALLATAKQVLFNLGKADSQHISIEDLASTEVIYASTSYNGDGIVTVSGDFSDESNKVINEIITCLGGERDRSGKLGITMEKLEAFFKAAKSYSDWIKAGKADPAIFCCGADTAANATILNTIKAKVDDYFTRCRLAAFDAKYAEVGQKLDDEYVTLLKKSLSAQTEELKSFTLAKVAAEPVLNLTKHINPAWLAEISAFEEKLVKPIVGNSDELTEADWGKIKAYFAPYEKWLASKAGAEVESIGEARLDEILASNSKEEISTLIANDKALEPKFTRLSNVDKLVRYYKNLYTLLNNFASFKNFYNKKTIAIFQAGTLYIDGRSCTLCIKVDDIPAHSARAVAANIYLIYCDCVRKNTGEKMNILASVTDGDSENLIVGRNGLFIDRKGNYWDAVIAKVVDHPISVRQAFWTPYKKLGKMINEAIEKYASSKDKSITEKISSSMKAGTEKLETAPTAPAPVAADQAPANSFNAAQYAGIFAAVGLALAAVGSAVSSIVSGFLSLTWWQMPLAIIGVLLLISGPSMIMTAMKLAKRNLGSILDANGWAINTKARVNITMGRYLTSLARLPENSRRYYDDPFAEKKGKWKYWLLAIIVALLVAFYFAPDSCNLKRNFKFALGLPLCSEQCTPTANASGTASIATATAKVATPASK